MALHSKLVVKVVPSLGSQLGGLMEEGVAERGVGIWNKKHRSNKIYFSSCFITTASASLPATLIN